MTTEGKIIYFQSPGQGNTEDVFRIARARSEQSGIRNILVASTTGQTGAQAADFFRGKRLIVVTHSAGFRGPNTQELTEENRQKIERNGGIILTTTHAFSGLSRAMRKKFHMYLFEEAVANTLRIFGEGMKVACEIALMAADAGMIRTDEDAIVMAGTGRGLDTAIVLRPVNSQDFFDLKVEEILCKPHF